MHSTFTVLKKEGEHRPPYPIPHSQQEFVR
jgi:hypothetical protein